MKKKCYYTVMSKDMKTCDDFQFEVGKPYIIDSKKLELFFKSVFRFCEKLEDIVDGRIDYFITSEDRHFVIEVYGDVVIEDSLSGAQKIRIAREISREDIEEHIQDKKSYNAKRFLALYTTNIKLIEKLSKDEDVLEYLARNRNTPDYVLENLAKSKNPKVRKAVAGNPNTSVHTSEVLVKDVEETVLYTLAENPNTPVHLLAELAKEESILVRKAVAENPNTLLHILELLYNDSHWWVRRGVALNPNASVSLLMSLSQNWDTKVSKHAKARLKEITQ